MPSRPFDTGWSFEAVLHLLDSDLDIASPAPPSASEADVDTGRARGVTRTHGSNLGDFKRLFDELGIADQCDNPTDPPSTAFTDHGCSPGLYPEPELVPPPNLTEFESDEPSSSDDALAPPPFVEGESVTTAIAIDGLTSKQKKQARKKAARKLRKLALLTSSLEGEAQATETRTHTTLQEGKQVRTQSNIGFKIRPATPAVLESQKQVKEELWTSGGRQTPAKPILQRPNPHADQIILPQAEHSVFSDVPSAAQVPYVPIMAPTTPVAKGTALEALAPPQQPSAHSLHGHGVGKRGSYQRPQATPYGLIPRTVQPVTIQRAQAPRTPRTPRQEMPPFTPSQAPRGLIVRPQVERYIHLHNQLMTNFPEDQRWLVSPMQLCNGKTGTEGIHCFVDASNIMIGFKDILRRRNMQQFELSFDSLALIMERRRPMGKRIYASSHREAAPLPHVTKMAETSKAVGYENNVIEQVCIRREESERKKFFKDVERMGWHKATQRRIDNGSGSDSDTSVTTPATPSAPKWVEQGVDEILHLKMCQSIIDTDVPTTMVLATGDGNTAEHSDGFLAQAERALKKGWKVELVSWKQQTSGGYKNKKFRAKWGEQFRIIELDDYVESLMDTP